MWRSEIEGADVIWTGWAFAGNDYEVSTGSSVCEKSGGAVLREAGRWLAGQSVDNGNISLLGSNITLKVNGSWRMEEHYDLRLVSWNKISLQGYWDI